MNLTNSFPHKKERDLIKIMQEFYKHFCDIIVEIIKGFTISKKELKKRLVIKNPEFTNQYAKKGKSIIIVGGHYNNWEMYAQAINIYSDHLCIGIYKPLVNKFIDNKIFSARSMYGTQLISMKKTKGVFDNNTTQPKLIIFASDQNPAKPKNSYWVDFLNQETAVLPGLEIYAKKYNWPVIFGHMNKSKRGHYEVTYSLISNNPQETKDGEITQKFTKKLEEDIINKPQYWLWSHRRWKHKK